MKVKRFVPVALGIGVLLGATTANAAKIDNYSQMILRGEYTIRYDNITPAPRVTNKDKMNLFGSSGMGEDNNDYLTNRPKSGMIVSGGTERYEEIASDDRNIIMCRLQKGQEIFVFTKYKKGDGYEYFGNKKGKVEANTRNVMAEIISGVSFGDADMSMLLNAMLPDSAKSANMPRYTQAGQGTLSDGIGYEDYKSVDDDGTTRVIRYYFNRQTLTKIAAAAYYRSDSGKLDGRKCIIKVNEFTPLADRTKLVLPAELEDVTKRDGRK